MKVLVVGSGGREHALAWAIARADRVTEVIRRVRPGVTVSNPLSAAKAALRALNLKRIGFVTPYVAEVSAAMRDNLAKAGFETVSFGSFEEVEDGVVARMTPGSILEAVLTVGAVAGCDGVFVSCTNLRAAGVLEEAEARLRRASEDGETEFEAIRSVLQNLLAQVPPWRELEASEAA